MEKRTGKPIKENRNGQKSPFRILIKGILPKGVSSLQEYSKDKIRVLYAISSKGKYMSYKNHGKRTYTEREKRAFSAGRGYAAAKAGKRVACKTEAEKQSFRNGVNAVRGKKATASKSKRKGGVKCQNCGYIIDADGVLHYTR